SIELGGAIRLGDPTRWASGDADVCALGVRRGRWILLGRADEDDPDLLVEVVFAHEEILGAFWAAYDEAAPRAAVGAPTGRVLIADGSVARDASLLESAYEPDDE